jgi:menaquinone-dependent protoporphyrinogen oxidase
VNVETVLAQVAPREHRVFDGKLDRSGLSRAQRAVARVVGAAQGDFRDWAAIDEWAAGIARTLLAGDG